MKKTLLSIIQFIPLILLYILLAYHLHAGIAYGLFGTAAAIAMLFSGSAAEAAELLPQIAFYAASAACIIPGMLTLARLYQAQLPARTAPGALPVSPALAFAVLGLEILMLAAAVLLPDSPYMLVLTPCFVLLGLLMLADRIRRKNKE